jgi:O-antigen/teichoic acid export membrane protein
VLVWLTGGGLIGFLAVWLAAAIAEWAAMWALGLWQLRRMRLDAPLLGTVRGTLGENEGLLPFIVTTNFEITLRELAPRLVPLAIGWVLTPAATGLYSLAQRASIVLEQPATLLGQASYSVIAKLVAAGDKRQLKRLIWRGAATAVALSAPVIAILAFFSTPLLGLLGGKTFRGGSTLLILLALSRAAAIAAPPFSSALIAMGKPSRSIAVNLASNLLLLPLLPLFLLWFGLDGAGWHSLLQASLAALALAAMVRQQLRVFA